MNWSIEELKTLRENYQSNAKELSKELESRSAKDPDFESEMESEDE